MLHVETLYNTIHFFVTESHVEATVSKRFAYAKDMIKGWKRNKHFKFSTVLEFLLVKKYQYKKSKSSNESRNIEFHQPRQLFLNVLEINLDQTKIDLFAPSEQL